MPQTPELPVAVDAMSGDLAVAIRVAGAIQALQDTPSLRLILVGNPAVLDPLLQPLSSALRERLQVKAASQVVAMHDTPRSAVRHAKDSSMRVAVDLVKLGLASACVSAGNTGALMAIGHFVLKTVAGVERAAIMSAIPASSGYVLMLDLGANAGATALQLAQFAAMGSIAASEAYGLAAPRVGLLNIGEEDIKGHEVVRDAHALISAAGLNYIGFVEGDAIFSGTVDVVVTDGFTGNVALKTMEGLARMIRGRLQAEFARGLFARLAGLLALPVLRRVAASLDPGRYNGACMVGLAGVVVKSHGRADRESFAQAVKFAARAVEQRLPGRIAVAMTLAMAAERKAN